MANEVPHERAPARAVSLPTFIALRATSATLVAAGAVLLAVAIRIWLTRSIPAPWIMGDELLYSSLAKSFSEHREMVFRQQPWPFLSIYPAVVSPAWLFGSMESTYSALKVMNVALMSVVAVPAYLWSRRLVSPVYAVVFVVLVLLMPSFVFVNEVMTESLAFPVMMFAFLAVALALERPTSARQGLALVAVALACATRLQAFVLFAAVPLAILLKAALDARAAPPPSFVRFLAREIARYAVALGVLVGSGLAYVAYKLVRGESVTELFGQYSGIVQGGYSLGGVARWSVLHVAELSYSTGLVPVSAFIVLAGLACRRNSPTGPAERAFLAVTVAATSCLVVQVAAFASRYSLRIEERNLFYLAPLFLLALVMWLDRGLPRPAGLTATAAIVPAALLVVLPLEGLLNVSIASDTFAFVPLLRAAIHLGSETDMRILLGLGAILVAVVFVSLPRRLAVYAIPLGIAAFSAVSSYSVLETARTQALNALAAQGVPPKDVNWVDDAVGTDAHVVFVNTIPFQNNPHTLWQAEFWNKSIEATVDLVKPHHIILGRRGRVDPRTGRIVTNDPYLSGSVRGARYAVAPATVELAGKVIAKPGSQLVLYSVDPPLRLVRSATGFFADGWTGGDMALTQYATPDQRGGRLEMRLLRPTLISEGRVEPARATLELGSLRIGTSNALEVKDREMKRSIPLTENRPVLLSLPVPRPPFRFQLHVTPTFSPVDIGLGDTRQLGIQLSFHFVPRSAAR